MSERDPMQDLLREWKSPEPGSDFDDLVASAYRAEFPIGRRGRPVLRRFWRARISVPLPVLLAATAAVALFLWLRPAPAPVAPPHPAEPPSGVLTQLNVRGFQPLPNGAARVVPVQMIEGKETR
jgi:hypothetical protein